MIPCHCGNAFAFWELLADEDDEKRDGRDQDEAEIETPVGILRQRDRAKASHHESGRPSGVEAVEPFDFVGVEHR